MVALNLGLRSVAHPASLPLLDVFVVGLLEVGEQGQLLQEFDRVLLVHSLGELVRHVDLRD